MQKGLLLKDLIPVDEIKKNKPKFYPKDSLIEITPLGIYVIQSTSLKGWLYAELKNKTLMLNLQKGKDYELC